MLIVCEERPEHQPAVYEINFCAFETETEARLVEALGVARPYISTVEYHPIVDKE